MISEWTTVFEMNYPCATRPMSGPMVFCPQEVDFDRLYLGKVPLCKISEYETPFCILRIGGRDSNLTPMRGSKRGIVIRRGRKGQGWGSSERTYEYEYLFAEWLGKRIAGRMIKSKKRIVTISTKNPEKLYPGNHHSASSWDSELKHGFYSVMDDFIKRDQGLIILKQKTAVIFVYPSGLSENQKEALHVLAMELRKNFNG